MYQYSFDLNNSSHSCQRESTRKFFSGAAAKANATAIEANVHRTLGRIVGSGLVGHLGCESKDPRYVRYSTVQYSTYLVVQYVGILTLPEQFTYLIVMNSKSCPWPYVTHRDPT